MKNRLYILSSAMLLVSASAVQAQLAGAVGNAFQMFFQWMQIESIMFGITFIFLLILFYGIFAAGLSRVAAFSEGDNVNRYGKMVALSLAVLATIGILFVLGSSPGESMRRILKTMGWFAGLAFAIAIFGISYLNFKGDEKTWPLTFFTTGLGMIVYGLMMDSEGWFSFGWTFLIVGLIWFLLAGNKKSDDELTQRFTGTRPDITDDDRIRREEELDNKERVERIRQILRDIRQKLDLMENSYSHLVRVGNQILQQNHDYHRGFHGSAPDPNTSPISGDMMMRFMVLHGDFINHSNRVSQNFDSITSIGPVRDEGVINEITELTGRHTTLLVNFRRYVQDFGQRLRNNEPPNDMYS